jgi:hypothetical protein
VAGKTRRDTEVYFQYEDYVSAFNDECRIILTDQRGLDLLRTCIRYVEYTNTRWYSNNGSLSDDQRPIVRGWIDKLWGDLMACEDLTQDVGRIATALESIDSKTPELVTLQDVLDDLGNSTLGTLVPYIEAFLALSDLLPNIDLQLPIHQIIPMFFDMYWKHKVAKALEGMAWSEKIENIIEGGETIAAGVEAIDDAYIDNTTDLISLFLGGLSSGSLAVIAFRNLLDLFTAPGADEDPDLRTIVRVYNSVFVDGDALTVKNYIDACCSGGSGGQSPDAPPIDYTDDGTTPPDGFDDYPSYTDHKCNAAHQFLSDVRADLSWLETADIAALTATGLGAALLVPGVNVAALLALLLLFVSLGVMISEINAVEQWLVDNEQDVLCAIVTGATPTESYTELESLITGSTLTTQQQTLLLYFATQSAVNRVYEPSNITYTGGDCSGCGNDCLAGFLYGSGDAENGGTFSSELTSLHRIYVYFGRTRNVTVSLSGWTEYVTHTDSIRISTEGCPQENSYTMNVYSGDANPFPDTIDAGFIAIFSQTSFTMEVTFND